MKGGKASENTHAQLYYAACLIRMNSAQKVNQPRNVLPNKSYKFEMYLQLRLRLYLHYTKVTNSMGNITSSSEPNS